MTKKNTPDSSSRKRFGIVSYNMYGNFTNYGSALQSYALQKVINRLSPAEFEAIVMDYCPDVLADKDILNPIANMWDTDEASRERCRLSLPAIHENYIKFRNFYKSRYPLSKHKYTSSNFNESLGKEGLSGYICGSDTIFAVPEFGFDDGFYASYESMRGRSIAYAASFGDYDIPESDKKELKKRLGNFKAIALRENDKKEVVESLTDVPVFKVIDPTLLLKAEDYEEITKEPEAGEPYLLLYSRRGNQEMQEFAEETAKRLNLKVIEISLNAHNAAKHTMRYDAGVEEFLGLVKNAAIVVTNSFHGMIFAILFKVPFYIFSRKLCDTKILELLQLLGLSYRMLTSGKDVIIKDIDYKPVHERLSTAASDSVCTLRKEIDSLSLSDHKV